VNKNSENQGIYKYPRTKGRTQKGYPEAENKIEMDKMVRSKSENRTARDAGWGKHNGQEADGRTRWQGIKRYINKMAR
jgi:hypothetical protein